MRKLNNLPEGNDFDDEQAARHATLIATYEIARQLALIKEGLQGPLKPSRQSSVGEADPGIKIGGSL
jgi:hypothetical protein